MQKESFKSVTTDAETVHLIEGRKSEQIPPGTFTEPITHVKNKTFAMKYCVHCSDFKRTRLTNQELAVFYSLRSECNIPFDPQDEEHNQLINVLWTSLTKEPELEQIPNPRWKDFGFQNNDPRTDFRGSGVAGLKMLLNYSRDYPGMIKRMSDPKDDFMTAVCSINVTYHLMTYFHMADFLDFEKDKDKLGSRKALKNFCAILSKDEEGFCKLYDLLFTDFHALWLDLKTKRQGVTVMDLKVCLDELKRKLDRAMNKRYYESFVQFQVQYSEIKNWSGRTPSLTKLS